MSHQTGIKANSDLLKTFGECKSGNIRLLKVSIENEELVGISTHKVKKDWETDYDTYMKILIEPDTACYILCRLDATTPLGHSWLLVSWVPDSAPVRQKMIYASTKATLKTEFGSAHIKEEIHATCLDEITLKGYYKNKQNILEPVPLTNREKELLEIKMTERKNEIGRDSRQALGGIAFPITDDAIHAIKEISSNLYNYVQFKIELEEEKVSLAEKLNITTEQLRSCIPTDHARYHIFRFRCTHEKEFHDALIFIYSMPGYSCPIKERMMYSSCKGPFLESLSSYGIDISKKLEIDDPSEITQDYLQDELHPKMSTTKMQFSKPKGPTKRGAKRIIRSSNDE